MSSEGAQEAAAPRRRGCFSQLVMAAVLVVVIAGLTAGAMYAFVVRPMAVEAEAMRSDLEAAESELAGLRPLVAENATLRQEARQAAQRLLVLEALVEVNAARVGLALREPELAAERIAVADEHLQALAPLLAGDLGADLGRMRDRLALAQEEIGRDAFAAQSDLDVLANDLAELAETLGD